MAKRKVRQRRVRGTGSIFQRNRRGRTEWVGRVLVGKKPDGKPLYVERVAPTQVELVAKLDAAEAPGPNTTVAAWSARWLAGLSVRPSTHANYEHTVTRFVGPTLGHLKVSEVTPLHVEHAAKEW